MTFRELYRSVRAELAGKKQRVEGRRTKILKLATKLRAWEAARRADERFRVRRRGASLTINETTLLEGGKTSLHLNVEVLGGCVGVVKFKAGKRPTFAPAKGLVEKLHAHAHLPSIQMLLETLHTRAGAEVGIQWAKNSRDARLLNGLLAFARNEEFKGEHERIIQALLNSALAGRKTWPDKADSPLKRFRPVTPGAAMEIGTVLSKAPSGATGQADVLVRRRVPGDTEFLVFELKAPNGDPPAMALEQAIRYALALDAEANFDDKTIASYRALFGSTSTRPLKFGAVAVVSDNHEEAAMTALGALGPTDGMTVGVLLYRGAKDWCKETVLVPVRFHFAGT